MNYRKMGLPTLVEIKSGQDLDDYELGFLRWRGFCDEGTPLGLRMENQFMVTNSDSTGVQCGTPMSKWA